MRKNDPVYCRYDEGYQQVFTDATEITKELRIFSFFKKNKLKTKKCQLEFETKEAPQDDKTEFQSRFLLCSYRHGHTKFEVRFQQLQYHLNL